MIRRNFDLWDAFDRMLVVPGFGTGDWHPRADVVETADSWQLHVELPGVSKEDISVSTENGVVTISGRRASKSDSTDAGTKLRRVERSFGSFRRSFALPDNADLASPKLAASLHDGVLDVTIPKRQSDAPKDIPISAKL